MGNGKGGSTLQGGFQCLGMDIGSGKNSMLCSRLRPWDFYIPPWKKLKVFEPKDLEMDGRSFSCWWFQPIPKNISQIGSFFQVGMKTKNV